MGIGATVTTDKPFRALRRLNRQHAHVRRVFLVDWDGQLPEAPAPVTPNFCESQARAAGSHQRPSAGRHTGCPVHRWFKACLERAGLPAAIKIHELRPQRRGSSVAPHRRHRARATTPAARVAVDHGRVPASDPGRPRSRAGRPPGDPEMSCRKQVVRCRLSGSRCSSRYAFRARTRTGVMSSWRMERPPDG